MKKESANTSKKKATKKGKTGGTKKKSSRTQSKPTMSPTWLLEMCGLSLKDTWIMNHGENLKLLSDVIPKSTCEFSLCATTESGKEVRHAIRIGPNGLEYRGPLERDYRKLG